MTIAKLSQCKRIIQYMKEHGVITTLAATRMNPPIMSLSRRITDLGRMGHKIGKSVVRNPRTKIPHKEYRLVKEAVIKKFICSHVKKCNYRYCKGKRGHINPDGCACKYYCAHIGEDVRCVKVKQ